MKYTHTFRPLGPMSTFLQTKVNMKTDTQQFGGRYEKCLHWIGRIFRLILKLKNIFITFIIPILYLSNFYYKWYSTFWPCMMLAMFLATLLYIFLGSTTFHWFNFGTEIQPSKIQIIGKILNCPMYLVWSISIIQMDVHVYVSKNSWNNLLCSPNTLQDGSTKVSPCLGSHHIGLF